MTIPIEYKRLLCGCKSRKDLMNRLQTFVGNKVPPYKVFNKANNLWNNRDKYLEDVKISDEQKESELHKVMVPVSIKTKTHACSGKSDSLPEVGEMLVKIQHLLAEMVQLQKELIEIQKEKP